GRAQEGNHTQVRYRIPPSATEICESPDPCLGRSLRRCWMGQKPPRESSGPEYSMPPGVSTLPRPRTSAASKHALSATHAVFDSPAYDLLVSTAEACKCRLS